MSNYVYPRFPYVCSPEQRSGETLRHPVIVIGAGPIGLTAALDLAARGQRVVVLDDNDTVSIGSRAVCYAKRPLEIWDRLGCAAPMVDKGVSWNIGKVFFRDQLSYQFDLLPEPDHHWPAMVNLQQYHLEEILVDACNRSPLVDLRWKHRLVSLKQTDAYAQLAVETPDGIFTMEAQWVIACDGANSDTRRMVGAEFKGQFFQDRFLIADVRMKAEFPTERWFWFDPPFHPGQSVLLHRQSDNIWRIDFQLGWDANPDEEKTPERVIPRIRAMLGETTEFELEWVSIYQFACRRIDNFRHGRILFAGDAAHQVSPFGARRQHRRAGHRQSRLEAGAGAAWRGAGTPDRQLSRGTCLRCRRQHPELDAGDRLHHPEDASEPLFPRRRARPRAASRVRTAADQQRPAVDAHALCRVVAEHG